MGIIHVERFWVGRELMRLAPLNRVPQLDGFSDRKQICNMECQQFIQKSSFTKLHGLAIA